MNKLIVICFLTVTVGLAFSKAQGSFLGKQEPACIQRGGLCMIQSQCMNPIGLQGEFCNEKGFQCCSGFPKDETHCKAHGGQCFKKGFCSQKVVYDEASDCGFEQDCCILM